MEDQEASHQIKKNDSYEKSRSSSSGKSKPKKPRHKPPRSLPVRLAISTLRLIVIGYVTILGVLIWKETSMVYPGAYLPDNTTARTGGPVQTVPYESAGGIPLAGRLLERPASNRYVLFFHGNASKAKWLDEWLMELSETFDATVMAAEYRGYEDDLDPTERGVLDDCFAARDFLCQRYKIEPTDIVLYGRSLGGGCAVAVASRGGAKALVLESTFDRMYAVAAERYPFIPVRWLMKNRYDSVAKMTAYSGPLVQIHSVDDTVIPFRRGKALFDRAGCEPKFFIEVSGVDHIEPMPRSVIRQAAQQVDEMTSGGQLDGRAEADADTAEADTADADTTEADTTEADTTEAQTAG